ncbi:hypothetical protein DERF_002072 [Dermatophagoides farinae]|uniref:Uncharacterized protein n=1 Tax=Dermatophagoides farinae TaxID=6954 RepID=A0A922L9A1_DERFA|nr:hypothetical protein DERF_002072 [Dermatophagoides farinae]
MQSITLKNQNQNQTLENRKFIKMKKNRRNKRRFKIDEQLQQQQKKRNQKYGAEVLVLLCLTKNEDTLYSDTTAFISSSYMKLQLYETDHMAAWQFAVHDHIIQLILEKKAQTSF